MITKKNILLSLLILPLFAVSQGIQFETLGFEEALAKAKKENKLVFIDFYTVWCGPCKKMAKTIFPLPEVGNFYNEHFVNLKLDAEKEGEAIAKQYNVTGYPTLLYLDTDGNVLLKDTAFNPEEEFIASGQRAVASLNSTYSLENLQKEFPNKLSDAHFLKMYNEKMEQYGQDNIEGVDAWLRVQTEMDEASHEMKTYLMRNTRYFIIGGKASQILDENLETYLKNASEYETKILSRLKSQIVSNTKRIALRRKNPNVLKVYIDFCKQAGNEKDHDLIEAELTYFELLNDDKSFKHLTEIYLDSLMNNTSISDTQQSDKATYVMYKKAYDKDPKPERERMVIATKEGLQATKILKEINEKGKGYLDRVNTKNEYKALKDWINYGHKLKTENCFMDDLKAEVYYKKGKLKKAIKLKERAVLNWPRSDKKFVNKEYELEQMKKGESI